jgi:hypothetical protein
MHHSRAWEGEDLATDARLLHRQPSNGGERSGSAADHSPEKDSHGAPLRRARERLPMKEIRPNVMGEFPRLARPGVHQVALGNGTAVRVALMDTERGLLVALCGDGVRGAYEFNVSPDVGYVTEKLNLKRYPGDAEQLTDFIRDQLGYNDAFPRCGTYHEHLTRST